MAIVITDISSGLVVSDIIRRVRNIANDVDSVVQSWEDPELFDWINDAAFAVVKKLPTARAVTANISLVDGALQSIEPTSARAIMLLDIVRNIAADGSSGRAIRLADRQLLDDQEPSWYTQTRVGNLYHFTFDERRPREFYVYPPALVDTLVEAVFSEAPPIVNNTTDILDLSDQYLDAIVNYVLYRAFSKDSEDGMAPASVAFYQAYKDALDIDAATEMAVTPNGASA